MRRNEELSLIYERIRIQQSTLDKGRTQYAERLKELRLLKQFMKEQTTELQACPYPCPYPYPYPHPYPYPYPYPYP